MNRAVALIGVCLVVTACGGSGSSPSPVAPPAKSATPPAAAFSVTGTVTDQQSGHGIAAAQVRVTDGADANKTAATDSGGAYTLSGLQPGEFNVNVAASGYLSPTQKVTLQADTKLSFALQAAKRTISGTVTDGTSHGILPNILLVVNDGASAGLSTHTDLAGNYTLTGVSADVASLQASCTSYVTSNWPVGAGDDVRVDIVMTRLAAPPPPPIPPPSEPAPPSGDVVIAFRNGSGSLTTYAESGFTVGPTAASWLFSSYGAPGPSAQFSTAAGVTTEGELKISAGGARFQFLSVDVYSSTTSIPYVFTGLAGSATVFTVSGLRGNTFGNFATVANAQSTASIDTLLIHLTNAAASCCSNPMGLDNIVLRR